MTTTVTHLLEEIDQTYEIAGLQFAMQRKCSSLSDCGLRDEGEARSLSFPRRSRIGSGITPDLVAGPISGLRRAHTAGPIAALEAARRNGRCDEARTALWVALGARIDSRARPVSPLGTL